MRLLRFFFFLAGFFALLVCFGAVPLDVGATGTDPAGAAGTDRAVGTYSEDGGYADTRSHDSFSDIWCDWTLRGCLGRLIWRAGVTIEERSGALFAP